MEQSIAFAQRYGNKVALLYMDIEHFKHINDSLGHAVGDQVFTPDMNVRAVARQSIEMALYYAPKSATD